MLKGISFQVLRAKYGTPVLANSRLYLGLWIFLQNRVLCLEKWDLRWNLFKDLINHYSMIKCNKLFN